MKEYCSLQGGKPKAGTEKKKRLILVGAAVLLLLLQLGLLLYYGNRKSGFHEDEFYSYYSTNKTAGLFVNDRQWLTRDQYRNDFVVLEGEEFRYDVVAMMQSWDVHPPFYYFLLHTVCSLFPGVFSKWLGLAVNLAGFVPCYFLLWYLVYTVMTTGKEKEQDKEKAHAAAFLTCLFWGFSAAVISGVMFIRMYQWLTLFVLLCACLHVRAMKKGKMGLSFYLPLAATVYLGFLTQYYYIIFHVFLGAGFCFWLLKQKKIKEIFAYAAACAGGLLAAILSYPACLSHIFRGYRGTEAVSEFSDASNTMDRLSFFTGLFDDYVLNHWGSVWLLALALLWVTLFYVRKRKGLSMKGTVANPSVWLLSFAALGYFFTISKTALLLGETSNRYQLPIYGILLFLLLYFLILPVLKLSGYGKRQLPKGSLAAVLTAVILLSSSMALLNERVFFLYEEEREIMAYVKENADVPVVIFYNEESPANVWRLSDELMEYPAVYLASQGNAEPITDEVIAGSGRLLAYVADGDQAEESLACLLRSNPHLSSCKEVVKKPLWTLYELGN